MKTLIVYYSLEGNTAYAAKRIAENIGADTLQIFPKKEYPAKGFAKFLAGGKDAVFKRCPELQPYIADLSAYERIVIGFPVWASNVAPPICTFVSDNLEDIKGKTIAAFACQGGGGADKALTALKRMIGGAAFEALAIFNDPGKKQSEETDLLIDKFSSKLND